MPGSGAGIQPEGWGGNGVEAYRDLGNGGDISTIEGVPCGVGIIRD